ncbi:hypothetical protein K456DRAFT_614603 [Colletotrichum gloeosporioides 23]|nr:hypothetical protein K456DRAFT_614603 [Colletotrichum gloeosporioides 23]
MAATFFPSHALLLASAHSRTSAAPALAEAVHGFLCTHKSSGRSDAQSHHTEHLQLRLQLNSSPAGGGPPLDPKVLTARTTETRDGRDFFIRQCMKLSRGTASDLSWKRPPKPEIAIRSFT